MSHHGLNQFCGFFSVENGKKEKVRKGTKSHADVVFYLFVRKLPVKIFFTKFCMSRDMPYVIICAKLYVKKLRGLKYTMGQVLVSFIEMAGQPYNSAALPRSL